MYDLMFVNIAPHNKGFFDKVLQFSARAYKQLVNSGFELIILKSTPKA